MTAEIIWQQAQRLPLSEQLKLAMLILEQAQAAISTEARPNAQINPEDRKQKLEALFGMFKDPAKAERIRAAWKQDFELEEEKFSERFGRQAETAP